MTRYQNGISALVSQTSFRGETIGRVAKCRLFSQATSLSLTLPSSLSFKARSSLGTQDAGTCDAPWFKQEPLNNPKFVGVAGVSRPQTQTFHLLLHFSCYIISCFLEIFRARKFVMVFWGVKFWSRDFLRFCWKP